MSQPQGYQDWEDPLFLLTRPYLDGSLLSGPLFFTVQRTPSPGVISLPTGAGTNIIQGDFAGAKSPDTKVHYEFSLSFDPVDDQGDYRLIMAAIAKGRAVYFTAGHPVVDVYQAISGQTYVLTRPLALGIVPDVTLATDYATRIYLNDVLTPGAATVAGQGFTANNTGEIRIEYTPVHRVLIELSESILGKNHIALNVTLTEQVTAGSGSFD